MTSTARTVLLGMVGLALAVAVGLAANAISRDSIGLAPTPAGSGVPLAPPKTAPAPARTKDTTKPKSSAPTTSTPTPTAPTTTSGGDDHGGDRGSDGSSGGSG